MANYINYGDLQIDQEALMNVLNNTAAIQNYVDSQPWSTKRKKAFLQNLENIKAMGILNISQEYNPKTLNYEYYVNTGGEKLDFNNMSRITRDMYGEAAQYIVNSAKNISTRASIEEAEKNKQKIEKTDLPIFDNNTFTKGFLSQLSKDHFGGSNEMLASTWNEFDKRNEKGIRPRTERAKMFVKSLENYAKTLNDSDYNFKDSPFGSLLEFKSRVAKAKDALLKTPEDTDDDFKALTALGLNASDFFNNGSGDPFTKGDYNGTYGDYYLNYLPKQLLNKVGQVAQLLALKYQLLRLNLYTKYKFYGSKPGQAAMLGTPIRDEYRGLEINYLNSLATKSDLTNLEVDELIGSFRLFELLGKLAKLSKEELNKFGPSMKSRATKFRKIPNVNGLYWDPVGLRVVRPINEDETPLTVDSLEIFNLNSPEALQLLYLNKTDFDEADWAELIGMGLDIASIVDEEPWSAGGFGLAAAGARNYGRTRGPGKWGFSDYLSQGFDYLTGAAGAVPLLGDTALAYKTYKNFGNFLRMAMRIPAFLDLWNSVPELGPIGKKFANGEDLTLLDWMTLGTFVKGLVTTRNLNVLNRASRKALKERGYLVSNRLDKKIGLTQSKPTGDSVKPTLKINIKGTEEEIPINPELKKKLDEKLSKAENNADARSKIIREDADVQAAVLAHMKSKDPNFKIKEEVTAPDGTKTTKISDDWNNAKVPYNESLRNARLFGNKFGVTPPYMRTSGGIYGEATNPIKRGFDNFENYLSTREAWNTRKGAWKRFKYGSNNTLKRMDKLNSVEPNTNILGILYSGKLDDKTLKELNNALNPPTAKTSRATKIINPKNSSILGKLIDGTDFLVLFGKNSVGKEEMFFIINGNSTKVSGKSLGEMKKSLGQLIKETNLKIQSNNKTILKSDDPKWKSFVDSIKNLKRKGFLYEQGGRIDKLKIQMYKNYILK